MFAWLLSLAAALAADWTVELPPVRDRSAAVRESEACRAAGYEARVTRRFRLDQGWRYVVVVPGLADEAAAQAAARSLSAAVGAEAVVAAPPGHVVAAPAAVAEPAPAAADVATAAEWLARARAAHGGPAGGSAALAVAPAVHFRFRREVAGAPGFTAEHDYWRDGAGRRLAIVVDEASARAGRATSSVSVAAERGAWVAPAGAAASARDIGVVIAAIDDFAPEAVLAVVLEVAPLLSRPEAEEYDVLDAEPGVVRVGLGGDAEAGTLAFVDLDPVTARIRGARYVTDAGPIVFAMADYREVAPGIVVPARLSTRRADGGREEVTVQELALAAAAPPSTFAAPAATP